MEGTIRINNCGKHTEISKKELCGILLKNSPRYSKSYPTIFVTEIDILLSKLQETVMIQIYKTDVVRLFFCIDHVESSDTLYLCELPKEILELLKNI